MYMYIFMCAIAFIIVYHYYLSDKIIYADKLKIQ